MLRTLKHIENIVIKYKTVRSKAATTEYLLIIVLILIFELHSDVMMEGEYSSNEPLGANKTTAKTNVGGCGCSLGGSALYMPGKSVCVCVCAR